MPHAMYSFDEMDSAAHQSSTQADDLKGQVEAIWGQTLQSVDALPNGALTVYSTYSTSASSGYNANDFLSSMIPVISQLLALRAAIASHLQQASSAARETERGNAHALVQ